VSKWLKVDHKRASIFNARDAFLASRPPPVEALPVTEPPKKLRSPKIIRESVVLHKDHKSLALGKEIMQEVRASAEVEFEKATQSMSTGDRAKLNRFLKNIEFLGDVGKAAGKSRVSRKLLGNWMNTPGVSWCINRAVLDARIEIHTQTGDTAEDMVFRVKVVPELEKDADHFQRTGQRQRESRVIAKMAANDLKGLRWEIVQAANNNDRHFFIDLGRILRGELSGELCGKIDKALCELYVKHPDYGARRTQSALLDEYDIELDERSIKKRRSRLGLKRAKLQKVTKNPA
jgi:hypothetical protein